MSDVPWVAELVFMTANDLGLLGTELPTGAPANVHGSLCLCVGVPWLVSRPQGVMLELRVLGQAPWPAM